jgi:hypothetical protein
VPPAAGRDPQSLDDRERLVTFEPPDYSSECARKPPDIVVEREVFFTRSSRVWHGGKIPQGSASEKGKRLKLQRKTTCRERWAEQLNGGGLSHSPRNSP